MRRDEVILLLRLVNDQVEVTKNKPQYYDYCEMCDGIRRKLLNALRDTNSEEARL